MYPTSNISLQHVTTFLQSKGVWTRFISYVFLKLGQYHQNHMIEEKMCFLTFIFFLVFIWKRNGFLLINFISYPNSSQLFCIKFSSKKSVAVLAMSTVHEPILVFSTQKEIDCSSKISLFSSLSRSFAFYKHLFCFRFQKNYHFCSFGSQWHKRIAQKMSLILLFQKEHFWPSDHSHQTKHIPKKKRKKKNLDKEPLATENKYFPSLQKNDREIERVRTQLPLPKSLKSCEQKNVKSLSTRQLFITFLHQNSRSCSYCNTKYKWWKHVTTVHCWLPPLFTLF